MRFPSVEELAGWIGLSDAEAVRALHARAYAVKEEFVGRRVSMRGLIEAGNVCAKDCRYCGIRKSNRNLTRYQLTQEDFVVAVEKLLDYRKYVLGSYSDLSFCVCHNYEKN